MNRQIVTNSGRYVTTMEGIPSIEDIALALCRTPVFVGQTIDFYSYAHHCLNISHLMQEHRIYGLLHASYVAVLGACPLQFQDGEYRRFTIQLLRALCSEHELNPFDKLIKGKIAKADSIAAGSAARVCGLPKADETWPTSKEILTNMEFVKQLRDRFVPEEMLKPNNPLQRYFIAKFCHYLMVEQTIQSEGVKDNGDD